MKFLDTTIESPASILESLINRGRDDQGEIEKIAGDLVNSVRHGGDSELIAAIRRLDWPDATIEGIEVSRDERDAANATISADDRKMLDRTATAVQAFHEAERELLPSWTREFGPGITLGQRRLPVKRAGVYVPSGKAFYPSTVLMNCIPARVAGVDEVVLCTPADKSGMLNPLVIAAADRYADRIFRLGGAPAIAAMAYGTATVPRVDVIVGPGNSYVNTAKRLVTGDVGIDSLAGPSDIAIIADSGATSSYVALDLLAQTEHGPENCGVLFSDSAELLDLVAKEMSARRATLSRAAILDLSDANILFIKTRDLAEAAALANELAPEHLELQVRDPDALLPLIRNAGALLIGDATGAPFGDYIAGPSHTLPTGGAARFSSPLSVATFLKSTSTIRFSPEAAASAAATVSRFAMSEGFDAHAEAARVRA